MAFVELDVMVCSQFMTSIYDVP